MARLVTDIYFSKGPAWRRRLLSRLADHHSRDIDPEYVEESFGAAAVQFLGGRKLRRAIDTQHVAERLLARKTAQVWKRRPADLLLYSGYARDAFRAAKDSKSLKILFLYHPHYRIIRDLLRADAERFPESAKAQESDQEVTTWWRWKFADEEISLADGVITASQFSGQSLIHAGFKKPTTVVPYFSKLRTDTFDLSDKEGSKCRFLFVGQGVVRKGLHHLFRAWREAKLENAELTCVCGYINPGLVGCIPPDVTLRRHLSYDELQKEYSRSHVFVMPSIIEGFGLVYNEARSYGNFIIYTPNTGGPDMNIDERSGKMVQAGNISELTTVLAETNHLFHRGELDFAHIARNAHGRNWEQYVSELFAACEALRAPQL
ncbi:glycosyltransferase family 4 protein [Bradyrhizobium genosp. SA-3]|uniref:glycosyltransferase family 4 protein n=1 Tax=Bradyrhizobium genosp. SA-3 TaxID=508868 RepID=UPI0013EE64BB|nr:glycosyltransferase family 4 protein [Bradyrhizobium genosp. SA-3]